MTIFPSERPLVRLLGRQVLGDLRGCPAELLGDERAVREHLLAAAQAAGATVVTDCFHRFEPHGVSGVVVIAESHLAIHTWPEHGYAAIDLFTCGAHVRPERCFEYLVEALKAQSHEVRWIERGL